MLATIIVSLVVAAVVGLIIADMVKKKKNGESPLGCSECGGSCGGCALSGTCHAAAAKKKKAGETI